MLATNDATVWLPVSALAGIVIQVAVHLLETDIAAWWQRRRISVRPGITCLWQVKGRNKVSFEKWMEMDLFYIDNWSLWMDIKLMMQTMPAVVRGTGS